MNPPFLSKLTLCYILAYNNRRIQEKYVMITNSEGESMKKTNVLGITLTIPAVKEAMSQVDKYLRNGGINIIGYLSTKILVDAGEDENLKNYIENMDFTICAETDILHAAGETNRNRLKEIENDEFIKSIMRKLVRGRHSVYLVADTQEKLQELERDLHYYQPNFTTVGTYALDELQGDEDYIVNAINAKAPDVIISRAESPRQEQFIYENKMKINAELWLALCENISMSGQKAGGFLKISNYINRKIFLRRVNNYDDADKNENV